MYNITHRALPGANLAQNMTSTVVRPSAPPDHTDIQLTTAYRAHGPRDLVVRAVLPDHIAPSYMETAA